MGVEETITMGYGVNITVEQADYLKDIWGKAHKVDHLDYSEYYKFKDGFSIFDFDESDMGYFLFVTDSISEPFEAYRHDNGEVYSDRPHISQAVGF